MHYLFLYIYANPVESVAAVLSISSRFSMKDKWLYTPSIMFFGSALWAVWSFMGGFWIATVLNALLAVLSLVNQYKWIQERKSHE